MKDLPICVGHRDGWCATRKKTHRYADSIRTICKHYVICCWGIERRMPDCPECLEAMRRKEKCG